MKLELQSRARRAVLRMDSSERPRLVLLAVGGPNQYLMGGLAGGILATLLTKAYFVTVTDRTVYVLRGPRLHCRPEELVLDVPLAEAAALVARVRRGRTWSALYLRLPDRKRPTRLNISYHSRPELDAFLARLPAAPAVPAPPATPVTPATPAAPAPAGR